MRIIVYFWFSLFFLACFLFTNSVVSKPFNSITTPVFTTINQQLYHSKMAIRAIVQDKQGFLWIGTTEGLYRFDGYQMVLFRHQQNNPNSLLDNHIEDLVVDHNGFLWIATRYNGLSRYDTKINRFIHFTEDAEESKSLSSNTLFEINQDQKGLWVGTANGLNFIDFKALTVEHFLMEQDSVQVTSLAIDTQDNLWLGSPSGLALFDKESHTMTLAESVANKHFPKMTIKEILSAEDGSLWLGTSFDGLWRYFPTTGELQSLTNDADKSKADGDSLLQVDSEHIWIGTTAQGIEVRNADTGELIEDIKHDSAIPYSLLAGGVASLFKDESGLIWVGNLRSGLQYYNPANFAYSLAKSSPNSPKGLSASDIDAVLALGDDKLLVSMGSNYAVDVIERNNGRVESLKLAIEFEGKERLLNVLTMLETKDKQVWLGSFPAYLSHYDPLTKQVTNFKVPLKKQRQGAVLGMIEDHETGYLWLAMSEGLLIFDPINQAFHDVDRTFNGPLRLIYQDTQGNIWAGNKRGLYIYNKQTQKWFDFNKQINPEFFDNYVTGILVDSKNRAWIGTPSDLYQFSSWFDKQAKFTSVNSKLARLNAGAVNILEDQQGRIWLSSEIFFDPETWQFYKLGNIERANVNGRKGRYQKTDSGLLLFGGTNGLLQIDTELIKSWQYQPPLVITQITIDQQSQLISNNMLFPSGAKSFSVNFAAIDFTEPENIAYRYRLLGYDDDWIETNAQQRLATYTALPPGDYQLEISAKNRANVWSKQSLMLNIQVEPNYYQTWWFRTLMILLALVLIYVYINWRVKKIAAQEHLHNQMLMASERADMMANLVEQKNQLLADVSHELRTPLTVLQLKVEALQHNLVPDVEASYEGLMDKIADINRLISDIYQLAQSDIGALYLELNDHDCQSLLKHWASDLAIMVTSKGFEWQQDISLPASVSAKFDKDKVKQVITNLVDNSFAYTDLPGKIALSAKITDNCIEIKVEDTAPDINENDITRIFERLFRVESSRSRATGGSGLGLAICKSIIEAHKGSIYASNSQLGGLAVTVKLPITVE